MKSSIQSVLIANRGEVALRIQSSCKACGMQTIAIYAPEDITLAFVAGADRAYALSGTGGTAYLAQDEIIDCAVRANADAIHPGYGFLSENAGFARKVIDAGLIWIGPSPECIQIMGNKERARQQAISVGIPVVPGIACEINGQRAYETALSSAASIGFPVILKDPNSGGGKGIRIARDHNEYARAWERVVSEASVQTKSDHIVIEKFLTHSRHIEVQIAGDGTSCIHLFDRDCSVQRKNQKIIEEAPALFIHETIRSSILEAACTLANSVSYDNVGTVEFLVTPDNHFYFLEMNTRLQVEHSVTEAITGIDVVALQLALAHDGKLPFGQDAITQRGHGIECRIYAENPTQQFMPSTGAINYIEFPNHPFVRIDHDLACGQTIGASFDPMIAKITAWGMDRTQATARMLEALSNFIVRGITTNQSLLTGILESNTFTFGDIHTQLLADRTYLDAVLEPLSDTAEWLINAAVITCILEQLPMHINSHSVNTQPLQPTSRWKDKQWK